MARLVRSGIKKGNIRLYSVFCATWREKRLYTDRLDNHGFRQFYSAIGHGQFTANGALFAVWKLPADKPLLDILFRNAYNKVSHRQQFKDFLAAKESGSNLAPKRKHWPANTLLK